MPGYELIGKEEAQNVARVFENGGVLFRHGFDSQRNGMFMVQDFEKEFAAYSGARFALAVSSGTAALRVALASLGIGKGDEVITQSFTFVATVEAIVESGATPKCANIDNTLNLDVSDLERLVNARTRAVIAVHMLGTPADVRALSRFCEEKNIALIEDTAWGCGGSLDGKALGTWGQIGTFSFDHAKAITTGEGGMMITSDEEIFRRGSAWHDHGHENNPAFPRWADTRTSSGFNFRMSELQGAVGRAQLGKLDRLVQSQRTNYLRIKERIEAFSQYSMREEPEGARSTYDAAIFFTPSKDHAYLCREALLDHGLSTKILPEALTWHFAGEWNHIESLREAHDGHLEEELELSRKFLEKSVALPVPYELTDEYLLALGNALESCK